MGKDPEWMMRRYTARQIFSMAETDVRRLTTGVRFALIPLAEVLGAGPRRGKGKKPPVWRGGGGKRKRGRRSGNSQNIVIDLDEDDSLEGVNAQLAPIGMKL